MEHNITQLIQKAEEVLCKDCGGLNAEICNNPDHGLYEAMISVKTGTGSDMGRLGCPVCGHDPEHKVPNSKCWNCELIASTLREAITDAFAATEVEPIPVQAAEDAMIDVQPMVWNKALEAVKKKQRNYLKG